MKITRQDNCQFVFIFIILFSSIYCLDLPLFFSYFFLLISSRSFELKNAIYSQSLVGGRNKTAMCLLSVRQENFLSCKYIYMCTKKCCKMRENKKRIERNVDCAVLQKMVGEKRRQKKMRYLFSFYLIFFFFYSGLFQ